MWAVFVAELLAEYGGTQDGFARAIGKNRATVSHWLRQDPPAAPPGIECCLRIAALTHRSASDVLRAAGKGAIADLIEQLYGGPARVRTRDPAVPLADQHFLADLHALDGPTQRAIRHLVTRLSPPRPRPS